MITPLRLNFRSAVLLAAAGFTLASCSAGDLGSKSKLNSNSSSSFSDCGGVVCEVIDMKTIAVDTSENLLTTMVHHAGVTDPSNATKTAYNSQMSKLPETGKVDQITAPMWTAITTLSSEVCNDLTNQEMAAGAQRRIFTSVDFTKSPTSSAPVIDDVIRRMARSFWSRNETSQEKLLIRENVIDAFQNKTAASETKNQMLYLCIAMLASLDAHKY